MTYKKFVKLWCGDRPTSEIAKDLGISDATVYAHAKKLRDLGVKLPQRQFSRRQEVDVDALNNLIGTL